MNPAKYVPTKPTFDVNVVSNGHERFVYALKIKRHNICANYHLKGLRTINCVLPGRLTTSIVPGTRDSYLVATTFQEGFTTALTTVSANSETHIEYQDLVLKALTHKVKIEQLAMAKYFKYVRTVQSKIGKLDLDHCKYTNSQIILAAITAF